jgi:hypothetical protein
MTEYPCQHIRENGEQCRLSPVFGRRHCWRHYWKHPLAIDVLRWEEATGEHHPYRDLVGVERWRCSVLRG